MKYWSRPKLLISKCLGETPCRYNGQKSTCNNYIKLKPFIDAIEVCPEEAIGLPTPREPIHLINNNGNIILIQPSTLEDYTESMIKFSNKFLHGLRDITGVLLKGRSPSCGVRDVRIYSGIQKGASYSKGKGLFGETVLKIFPYIPVEEEGRITNFSIREHFLTRIFTLADFNERKKSNKLSSLIEFHSKNKLLFMAYNQTGLKRLEKIVANNDNKEINEIYDNYSKELLIQLSKAPRYTSNINVLMHSLGYFSEKLAEKERVFTLELIEKYKIGKVPLSVPINILKSYAIRFDNTYLLSQNFLEPYPEELMDVSDSGKGVVR